VASEPQALDAIPLIRRKRAGEGGQDTPEAASPPVVETPPPVHPAASRVAETARSEEAVDAGALRMKPRETIQLAAVHVRIPEQIARGLRLMSVLEGRQAQELAAEAFEAMLDKWNPRWRDSVPPKG